MPRQKAPAPRHHERVTIPVAGFPEGLRVVLTESGPLESLVDYFRHLVAPSPTHQRKTVLAVGLLWDFYVATRPAGAEDYAKFLAEFVRRLGTGTVAADGTDPLDLNWHPVAPTRASEIVRLVTAYSDYCALVSGAEPLNAMVPASFTQRVALFRRYTQQSAASLLKHLFNPAVAMQRAAMTRRVEVEGVPTRDKNAPPFFPFTHTTALLQEGFRRSQDGPLWRSHHVRDLMIAVLQRFGGVRVSEPFHLFVQDVEPVVVDALDAAWGTTALVRVFHPSAGTITYADKLTGRRVETNRADYLLRQWGRIPRDQIRWHGEWAGWKDPLLDDDPSNAFTVQWYPRVMGAYFWRLYAAYLRHVLPSGLDHPYLFVNLDDTQDGNFGAPYRIESYTDQLRKAVARIGLRSSKAVGTTSHGLRHAYAQTLRASGVSEKSTQTAMHHKSPLSQQVYTRPTRQSVAHELDQAAARARRLDDAARQLRLAVPGEIAAAEARARAPGAAGIPPALMPTLDVNYPRLLP